ncbi:MAG TPA: hypothetical protein VG326_19460 [Tepidisphaeraceae bacterium]|jgi:hypothetical protein|nr:hypothetical protein [Tepidisphaeraceae bacterium]
MHQGKKKPWKNIAGRCRPDAMPELLEPRYLLSGVGWGAAHLAFATAPEMGDSRGDVHAPFNNDPSTNAGPSLSTIIAARQSLIDAQVQPAPASSPTDDLQSDRDSGGWDAHGAATASAWSATTGPLFFGANVTLINGPVQLVGDSPAHVENITFYTVAFHRIAAISTVAVADDAGHDADAWDSSAPASVAPALVRQDTPGTSAVVDTATGSPVPTASRPSGDFPSEATLVAPQSVIAYSFELHAPEIQFQAPPPGPRDGGYSPASSVTTHEFIAPPQQTSFAPAAITPALRPASGGGSNGSTFGGAPLAELTAFSAISSAPLHPSSITKDISARTGLVNVSGALLLAGETSLPHVDASFSAPAVRWVDQATSNLMSWLGGATINGPAVTAGDSAGRGVNIPQAISAPQAIAGAAHAAMATLTGPILHAPANVIYRFATFDPNRTFADAMAAFAGESASISPVEAARNHSHRAWFVTGLVIGADVLLAVRWYAGRKHVRKKSTQDPQSPQAVPLPLGL